MLKMLLVLWNLSKGNIYINFVLEGLLSIWWVKQGMFGCILQSVQDHSS